MSRESGGPWAVAEPLLLKRSRALLRNVECCRDAIEPAEHIHKLRVASRRMEAALDAFAPVIAPKRPRKARKRVKGIRRAAGRIRDLDVLILRLETSVPGPAEDSVIRALRERRRQLANDLTIRLSQQDRDKLRRSLRGVTHEAGNGAAPVTNMVAWASGQMQPIAADFLETARADLHAIEDLHRLRLQGKRLRYSLELFKEHIDPDCVSRLLKSLRRLQEKLGEMNDHASAQETLNDIAESVDDPAVRTAARKLAKGEKRILKREMRRFLKWWYAGADKRIARRLRRCVPTESTISVAS